MTAALIGSIIRSDDFLLGLTKETHPSAFILTSALDIDHLANGSPLCTIFSSIT